MRALRSAARLGRPAPAAELRPARAGLDARLRLGAALALVLALGPADLTVTVARSVGGVPAAASGVPAGVMLSGAGYLLRVDDAGVVTAFSSAGTAFARFPLAVLAGRTALPADATVRVLAGSSTVTAEVVDGGGSLLERTVLEAGPRFVTVTFSTALGPDHALGPRFFDDGTRGLDLVGAAGTWTPDGNGFDSGRAHVQMTDPAPLSPPPFDIELHVSGGWLGVGLEQVPNATAMQLAGNWISVDYPLDVLASVPDTGGGGMRDGLVRFPSFVLTLAPSPLAGLRSYRAALVALGQAPAALGPGPAWWQQPIVDTWGEQMAEGAIRDSPRFTADWVRQFVAHWEAGSGVRTFTLVVDARWMVSIGATEPDPMRFGSWAGLRELIDSLHAQGVRVMLWWPLWYPRQSALGDPTRPDFPAATAQAMARLLGAGPGELHADGLKIDWNYSLPAHVADPALGWGAAALYRYLGAIHLAAHAVFPEALVESGAAAPQFAAITDAIRLNDATTEEAWDNRAMVAATADPGMLIDGDGWTAGPENMVAHAVSSAVYGVPAFYFVTHWMGQQPIPTSLLAQLGQIAELAERKGRGIAVPLSGGGWLYQVDGAVTAQTFDGDRGLVVWDGAGCDGGVCATVISMSGGPQDIPLPAQATGGARVIAPDGREVPASRRGSVVEADLAAGVSYRLDLG